ncbi:hypothetical protein MSIMFB_05687 [Mycobacterium simulans]|uniref:Uncharacterized protein n=1 Tax=Mycobacterium simulans TaxID=627089 RepID=A0A7Z7IQY0_9MYCO|nr:hypothetical protein MSIMFB_05687 [Mycobacterium simulans]
MAGQPRRDPLRVKGFPAKDDRIQAELGAHLMLCGVSGL